MMHSDKKNNQLKELIFVSVIVVVSLLSWYKSLDIRFLNDDYQIILWNAPSSFGDIFGSFHKEFHNTSYWRPVPPTATAALLYFFDLHPQPFHVFNLVAYSLCVVLAGYALRKLGFSYTTSLVSAAIFAVLPSHEIIVAWLAAKYDLFIFFFILAAVILYLKFLENGWKLFAIASAFCFLIAVLSKEAAFSAAVVPILLAFTFSKKGRQPGKALWATGIGTGIIILALLARLIIVGGNPFTSQNFNSTGLIEIIRNFVLYIPASFIRPESIENIYYYYLTLQNPVGFAALVIMFILGIIAVVMLFRSGDKKLKRLALFGILWYCAFIIPALPYFGRWYSFLPSFGLLIFLAALLQNLLTRRYGYVMLAAIIPGLLFFMIDNYHKMENWITASEKTDQILSSLKKYDFSGYKSVTLWGAPDKINRVNVMKEGLQETFDFVTGAKNIDVRYPLKSEIQAGCKFLLQENDSTVIIKCTGKGRFLKQGGKSTSISKKEVIKFSNDDYSVEIYNYLNHNNGKKVSKVIIKRYRKPASNLDLYFNGDAFVR